MLKSRFSAARWSTGISVVPLQCHLEQLTIYTYTTLYGSGNHLSPIPAIAELISTTLSSLKKIFLNFPFGLWGLDHGPNWFLFTTLATKCSSLSIKIYIALMHLDLKIICPGPLSNNLSLLTGFHELIPYVEKGVVVMISKGWED